MHAHKTNLSAALIKVVILLQLLMERAPLLRLKREIEASGDEEAFEPQEDHHDLKGDQHDPEVGGDGEDHPQVEPDGDEAADGGDDDKADADRGDDDKADADGDPDGGHLDISETEEAEASGDDLFIDYLRE